MAIQSNFPAIKPTLLLDFANVKALDPRITFTRASTATYVDQFGVMQTAASGVARFDHNPTTEESLGLLIEEQRTNLVLNSATLSTQNVTVTAVAHTLSFYGTGTVTLSGVSTAGPLVGTGAYPNRVTLTFTPTAGTLTLTVSGSVQLAQLEIGAFPTSYIQTVASQVTRIADVVSMTGTNFSDWYNQAEGTLYGESSVPAINTSGVSIYTAATISDGTTNNFLNIRAFTTAGSLLWDATGRTSGVDQFDTGQQTYGANVPVKNSLAYATNNVGNSVNGQAVSTDTSVILPLVNQLVIGGATNNLNGHIRKLSYYPLRVSNTNLVALTS
jgi:hypothetical protein